MSDETKAGATVEKTGAALYGKFPLNHRKRAEALAKAGVKKDPDGLIEDGLIEDAKERVSRLEVAERAAKAEAAKSETKAADAGAAAKGE